MALSKNFDQVWTRMIGLVIHKLSLENLNQSRWKVDRGKQKQKETEERQYTGITGQLKL